MACEQGDFSTRVGIVQPDTDATSHRQPRPIRRIDHRSVTPTDASFAQTGFGTFGQPPAGIVLGKAGLHTQDKDP